MTLTTGPDTALTTQISIQHIPDKTTEIHRDSLQRLAPCKGEQPMNQRACALGRFQRAIDQPLVTFKPDPRDA